MASMTWWTWVWAISRSWWWTGKPGKLQSMGSQRVGHDWVTELNWKHTIELFAAAAAKSLQLCPTLCDPIDGSAPGSPIPGQYHPKKVVSILLRTYDFKNFDKPHFNCLLPVSKWLNFICFDTVNFSFILLNFNVFISVSWKLFRTCIRSSHITLKKRGMESRGRKRKISQTNKTYIKNTELISSKSIIILNRNHYKNQLK